MKRTLFTTIVFLLLSWGCTRRITQPPIEPPVPDPIRSAITVLDENRAAVPGLTCTLQPDAGYSPIACDYNGIQAVFMVPANRLGWGGELILTAPEFLPIVKRVIIEPDILEVTMYPDVKPLPALRARGQYIEQTDGQRWTYIGATDFNLLARYVHGEDITPILQQRSEVGFNVLRIFTAFNVCPDSRDERGNYCQPIGRLVPSELYYDKLESFLKLLAKYNLYAELTGFAGKWDRNASDDEMVAHWINLISHVCGQPHFVFVELANEWNHPANAGVPLDRMSRPSCSSAMFSNASAIQDSEPRLPVWDYATYRPGSGPEWPRKVAHNAMEDVADPHRIPAVANETTRVPDNDNNEAHVFDAAAGAALLSAGATFHSVSGKNSSLWQGVELNLARAWAAGARSVPLRCQGEFYRRTDDFTFLRTYSRGTDPACTVRIRY